MDKLESDFKVKASELCLSKGNYNVLEKRIDVLEIDETPAYGLETKLKLAINGVVECIQDYCAKELPNAAKTLIAEKII